MPDVIDRDSLSVCAITIPDKDARSLIRRMGTARRLALNRPETAGYLEDYGNGFLEWAEHEFELRGYFTPKIKREYQKAVRLLAPQAAINPKIKAIYAAVLAFGMSFNDATPETVDEILGSAEKDAEKIPDETARGEITRLCGQTREKIAEAEQKDREGAGC